MRATFRIFNQCVNTLNNVSLLSLPVQVILPCLVGENLFHSVSSRQVSDIRQLVVYVIGNQASLSVAWSAVAEWFGGQVPPATLLGVAGLGYAGQLVAIDTTIIKA
jgi:hypothetical protein